MKTLRAPLAILLGSALAGAFILALLSGDYDMTAGDVLNVIASHAGADDGTAGLGVQVAGGLVGQDHQGVVDEGPGFPDCFSQP